MLKIIEGICYTNPHLPILVAGHPVMNGVWCECARFLKKGAIMAPLLVDDREQKGGIVWQKPYDLWMKAKTGRLSWPSLGADVLESELEATHHTSNCSDLYMKYHVWVLNMLPLFWGDWQWIKIHPMSFKETHSKTFLALWDELNPRHLDEVAVRMQISEKEFRAQVWDSLLSRFRHHWVADDGQVIEITRPVSKNQKEIAHEPIE